MIFPMVKPLKIG